MRADYILLLNFIGFFIFTGNMGNIEFVSSFLRDVLSGREFLISVALSQVISNVPATLMLSGFTDNSKELLIGVNTGGLGTLIASMASLISYKAYTKEFKQNSLKYVALFTAVNLAFLAVLIAAHFMIY
jgi:Na+/H+ antiporter NhaD/arsenite permease-like protein